MPRIEGPSRQTIRRRGDEYASRFVASIRDMLRAVTADFHGVVTLDDLTPIMREWKRRLANGLTADVGQAYADAAHVTRVAQRDALVKLLAANGTLVASASTGDTFEIPAVANRQAEELMASAGNRLVNVGNDVWEHARGELLAGLQNGEGIPQLRDRVVGATDLAASRAETIARTEIAGAMNAGALDQMRQIDAAGMTQEWIAVSDARTRPEHAAMNGMKVGINDAFPIGEPGDEPNCRCTLGFDMPDEQLVSGACDCLDGEVPLPMSVNPGDDLTAVCACETALGGMSALERRAAVTDDAVLAQMKTYADLSPKFKKAVAGYQNGQDKYGQNIYETFNRWLRSKSGDLDAITKNAPKHVSTGIDGLDKAIASSKLKADVKTFKGVANGRTTFGDAWSDDDMSGVTWTNHAYSSTSSDVQVAQNFTEKQWDPYGTLPGEETPTVLNIFAPKGSSAVSPTDPKLDPGVPINIQKEVLLPRGTKYRIVTDRGIIDGIRYLDAEVLV